jgi:hypothetical protein
MSRTFMTTPRRTLHRAAPLALACLALGAGGAEAKVPKVFFGAEANPGGSLSQTDSNRMRSARLGTLRVTFNWGQVEPTPGAERDWSYYDTIVERAARARTTVMAVLSGSPSWAADGSAYAPQTPAARSAYYAFVRDLVRRYGHGGSFWRSHRRVPRRPLAAYQVWNEPNYPPHWGDGPSRARDYASLLKQTARTIRAVDRKAVVATAGLLASSTRGPAGYAYLDDLYAIKGIRKYFDAVSVHPYAEDARGVEGELTRIRRVMRRRGDGRTPIWISELGWATGGGSPYFSTTPAGQAKRLTSAFRFVVRNRARFGVSRLIWFSWSDRPGPAGRGWEFYCGLFQVHGEAKPAWAAFRKFTRATR